MTKGTYVDGYVLVIPKKQAAAYKKMAQEGAETWMKFGALDYKECMGDDIKVKKGQGTGFAKMSAAKTSDTVWFSYIVFKNKKHRDAVNKKVMAYFAKKFKEGMEMPFDMSRMAYGGFKVEVSG